MKKAILVLTLSLTSLLISAQQDYKVGTYYQVRGEAKEECSKAYPHEVPNGGILGWFTKCKIMVWTRYDYCDYVEVWDDTTNTWLSFPSDDYGWKFEWSKEYELRAY